MKCISSFEKMQLTVQLLFILSLMLLPAPQRADVVNCVAPGTFRERDDPTCTKYYTCTLLLGLFYQKQNYSCGFLQRFNPTTQVCDYTSVCIDSFCDNQLPLAVLPDPNAVSTTCRATYIQCTGIINQYPVIEQCATTCC